MNKEDKDEIYKNLFKVVNGCTIISCWLCNYVLMFQYSPSMILLTEIGIFIFVNILLFIICKVVD